MTWNGVGRVYEGPVPVVALQPTTLTVSAGDRMAVVGPSGSGKSTLLNLLGLLDAPSSGHYLLRGVDVTVLKESERAAVRASLIGFVFQAFHLVPTRTVRENVELGLLYRGMTREARVEQSVSATKRVGLGHRIDAHASTLSGGERQRVAIARAIVADPEILLCDEPTGNLDSVTSRIVLDLLDDVCGDHAALVIVTHDEAVATRCQRRLELCDGAAREVTMGSVPL